MCTQLTEACNIANIYPALDILHITGGKSVINMKLKIEDLK